ncbi:MAG: transposase [Parahaliea sp.]
MGDARQFRCGRDASAALGLVPRQHSTDGRDRLDSISKRGDAQVRALVVHGARAVVSWTEGKSNLMSYWIQQVNARRGFNTTVVALANKMIVLPGRSWRALLLSFIHIRSYGLIMANSCDRTAFIRYFSA